jgi:tRNA(fMet)-specific endonuclease VapC
VSAERYALDTNICIYLLNGRMPEVARRLRETPSDRLVTTVFTAAELRYGAFRSARRASNLARVETFLAPLPFLPFNHAATFEFARVKAALAAVGKLIGPMDLLIAATALAHGATVVTNNEDEFRRVEGLDVENWVGGTGL